MILNDKQFDEIKRLNNEVHSSRNTNSRNHPKGWSVRNDLLTLMMTGRKEGIKMTVKELVEVCSSATCIRAYDSVDAMDDGKYFKSYGVLREFAEEYGECEVLAIYPEFKDYLCVAIEVEDEQYHFEDYRFVKLEREQFYKGIKIETIRWYYKGDKDRKKRDYRIIWKNGMVSVWNIEKGHGMKELKNYINVLIELQDKNPLYKSWVG